MAGSRAQRPNMCVALGSLVLKRKFGEILVGHDGDQPGSETWEAETGGQEGLSLQIMSKLSSIKH